MDCSLSSLLSKPCKVLNWGRIFCFCFYEHCLLIITSTSQNTLGTGGKFNPLVTKSHTYVLRSKLPFKVTQGGMLSVAGVSYPRSRDGLISLSVFLSILEVKHDRVCLCFCLFFTDFTLCPYKEKKAVGLSFSLQPQCDLLGKAKRMILL